jgi:primosomal protein N' (replication factor Y)
MWLILYALIVVDNPSPLVDKPFHYLIPPHLKSKITTGSRVAVPFGYSNKPLEGYVVGISEGYPDNIDRIKAITRAIDTVPMFSRELIGLAAWMREEYICTWSEALHCIMPARIVNKGVKFLVPGKHPPENHRDIAAYHRIIQAIKSAGGMLESISLRDRDDMLKPLERLIKDGYILQKEILETKNTGKHRLWVRPASNKADDVLPSNAVRMKAVMSFFSDNTLEEISCSMLMDETGCSLQSLRAMEKKGLIELFDKRILRQPHLPSGLIQDRVEQMSHIQEKAVARIQSLYAQGFGEVLLHGITGSGKTEVYMRLIGNTINEGKKAIVLVPEISLTPQMVEWYHKRFGKRAAVFHSKLSVGERYDQWEGIKRGDYDVAIGARSAIFAPFENIGLIIIDEEHEHTYKSESSPRYVTHRVAHQRCSFYNGLLVMGSATPSVETRYRAKTGEIGLVEINERAGGSVLPAVEVVDMREELKEGNRSVFSKKLTDEVKNALSLNQQVMLFLNRRGYSNFVSCRDCGSAVKCKGCDISLTYHRSENSLVCHYCGYRRKLPEHCEVCGSKRIKHLGSGTEKLEKAVESSFLKARILRMDMDTTRKKDSHYNILKAFRNREADILIGTQMIAKGLDFPNVTLVGVILADYSLNLPDYRAAEKTFQLLTQVSGRAGRGSLAGKVVIQTYLPGHYSIIAAKSQDYEGFYDQEIKIRERFGYPPFTRLINIVVSGAVPDQVAKECSDIADRIRERLQKRNEPEYEIYGPSPAPHSKIKGKHRWQVIIKGKDLKRIIRDVRETRLEFLRGKTKNLSIIVDVDPVSLN